MPLIVRFGAVKIHVYADDHNPPHFHVSTPDHDALISIAGLSVLHGQITRRNLELVRAWASSDENRKVLEDAWQRLNQR